MLWILSWNYRAFPWNEGPKLSWISNEVDIILLVEAWEHKESKVPNIDGFVLWSTWNKQSYHRGLGGIACYIRKTISTHARIYKKYHCDQYISIEIRDINDKKNLYNNLLFFPY